MKRSVLVLLDFSKAYDTVWREKLLLNMAQQGVPSGLLRWLRAFLQNRQAKVRFNNTMSRSKIMKQGLPQGSVLSPLLFLYYINNLANILPTDNLNALFADDVSILATNHVKEEAERSAQTAVDTVVGWAKEWKLKLNADKSETSFFSTGSHEAQWTPKIQVDGKEIRHDPTPRLLGVYLDRNLFFGAQTDHVVSKISSKQKIISAVANTTWGWRKEYLTRLYTAFIESSATYAGFAWLPCTAKSHIGKIERAQNKALRLVTGQYRATPVEALRKECGLNAF